MNLERRCVRCGSFYKYYVGKYETNAIMLVKLGKNEEVSFGNHSAMDLCLDCLRDFCKWFNSYEC